LASVKLPLRKRDPSRLGQVWKDKQQRCTTFRLGGQPMGKIPNANLQGNGGPFTGSDRTLNESVNRGGKENDQDSGARNRKRPEPGGAEDTSGKTSNRTPRGKEGTGRLTRRAPKQIRPEQKRGVREEAKLCGPE